MLPREPRDLRVLPVIVSLATAVVATFGCIGVLFGMAFLREIKEMLRL